MFKAKAQMHFISTVGNAVESGRFWSLEGRNCQSVLMVSTSKFSHVKSRKVSSYRVI